METLCAENPAIGRLGVDGARSRDEDVADTTLAAGQGRQDEYLAEMKSGLKYQARFVKLKSKTA
jgi:hypothetical protein